MHNCAVLYHTGTHTKQIVKWLCRDMTISVSRVNCCWLSPAQSFLVPSAPGLMTIFASSLTDSDAFEGIIGTHAPEFNIYILLVGFPQTTRVEKQCKKHITGSEHWNVISSFMAETLAHAPRIMAMKFKARVENRRGYSFIFYVQWVVKYDVFCLPTISNGLFCIKPMVINFVR
jgi:hypothetical protein